MTFIKKNLVNILILITFVVLWKCQLLKGPAASVLSLALTAPPVPSSELQTIPADYNVTLTNLKGETLSMSSMKGKVIFLNFWATWCAPCLAEMPDIQDLSEEMKGLDIVFALVSNEKPEIVKKYIKRKKYSKELFYTIPQYGSLPRMYHTNSIPTTFIIDKDGNLIQKDVGAFNWDDEDYVNFLKGLANSGKYPRSEN